MLTSVIVPPIDSIDIVETNNLWVLVERLSKNVCLPQTISHVLALKFLYDAT